MVSTDDRFLYTAPKKNKNYVYKQPNCVQKKKYKQPNTLKWLLTYLLPLENKLFETRS